MLDYLDVGERGGEERRTKDGEWMLVSIRSRRYRIDGSTSILPGSSLEQRIEKPVYILWEQRKQANENEQRVTSDSEMISKVISSEEEERDIEVERDDLGKAWIIL